MVWGLPPIQIDSGIGPAGNAVQMYGIPESRLSQNAMEGTLKYRGTPRGVDRTQGLDPHRVKELKGTNGYCKFFRPISIL